MFNVLDYGAKGNGITDNRLSIQKALDACKNAGGGTVFFPNGQYVTGTIELYSNITLYLDRGAEILGSKIIGDYSDNDIYGYRDSPLCTPILLSYHIRPLIYARNCSNICIKGGGTINGQSQFLDPFPNKGDSTNSRPMLIVFENCSRISISDILLKNPSMWCTRFEKCEDMLIEKVIIESLNSYNGDGLDFAGGGKNIIISDCIIRAGDDCISLKSFEKGHIFRNIIVKGCIFSSWWGGVRIGAETNADMSEISVTDCVFDCVGDAVKIHSSGGATIQNIIFNNLIIRNAARPFFIVADIYSFSLNPPCRPAGGIIKNIHISNVLANAPFGDDYEKIVADKKEGSIISGSYGGTVESLFFENITISAKGGHTDKSLANQTVYEFIDYMDMYAEALCFKREAVPSSAFFLRNVKKCIFKNIKLSCENDDVRPSLSLLSSEDCELHDISCYKSSLSESGIITADNKNCTISFSNSSPSKSIYDLEGRPQLDEYLDNRKYSKELFDKQESDAIAVDNARTMKKNMKTVSEKTDNGYKGSFTLREKAQKAYLYFVWAQGNGIAELNGLQIGSKSISNPLYNKKYYWAIDITDTINKGVNEWSLAGDFELLGDVYVLYE